jgi:hypothetical protein
VLLAGRGQVAERGQPQGRQRLAAGPLRRLSGRRGGRAVNADPRQFPLGLRELLRRPRRSGHGRRTRG